MSETNRKTVEEYWEYWQPIVAPNGVVDVEQLKKELSDYSYLGSQVSQVYCHVTGGLLGKIMYEASTICNYADDYYAKDVEEHEKDLREEFAAVEEVLTAQLATVTAERDEARVELSNVKSVLKELEWWDIGYDCIHACISCRHLHEDGHAEDCKLAAALGDTTGGTGQVKRCDQCRSEHVHACEYFDATRIKCNSCGHIEVVWKEDGKEA